ncbi:MAG: T9SS type A sorting domain-containing protein [Bacteroidetes bacterium]|nr:T9SS type A sorting domain-containing protein [Bacteroidota bacterium]
MKNISLILVALFCALLANAQIVNIPDANFKNALINHIPVIDTNGDGEIQLSEAQSFSGSMNVSSKNIFDLTGIEAFTALTELNCASNQIDTLDVSNNTVLEVLDCSCNHLDTLDVRNNTALDELYCYSNSLITLDVCNNIALKKLYCHYNQLGALVVSNITTLVELCCAQNQLIAIDVSNNTALTRLVCSNNQLSTLDLSNNTALDILHCNYNQLSTLYVSNNTAIIELLCSFNPISTLDVSNNTLLESLYCDNDQLLTLNVSNNTILTSLSCDGNQLSTLDVSNNINLTKLWCSSNPMGALDVSNNTDLVTLICVDIQLSELDVSNNTALETLWCQNNQLSTLDVSSNTALEYLSCSANQLTTLDVTNNMALKDLSCYDNLLSALDVSNNLALEELHCHSNQLSTLDVSNNMALTVLWCRSNQLTCLNVRNGNNINFSYFQAYDNPDLYCIEVDDPAWSIANWTIIDAHATFGYNCFYDLNLPNQISGSVVIDTNCSMQGTERGIRNLIVKTLPENIYASTDDTGAYMIQADTGNCRIEQIPLANGLLLTPLCPDPNYYDIYFDSLNMDTSSIDFHNHAIECPYLLVDINSDRRRRCFRGNTLVRYCNDGYADENNVEITVEFPDFVTLISANKPYTIDSLGNYVFDIGLLAEGDCGSINIVDSVSCINGITGVTQCTKAWISPLNDCARSIDTTALIGWDHSSIMVVGKCVGDSIVRFVISNTGDIGTGNMESPREYRIFIDDALVLSNDFQLNGQEILVLGVQATGQTVRVEADQHPLLPGNSHPSATVEGCGEGGIPVGLMMVDIFSMDDEDPEVEIQCMEIIDSYDPNDKNVSPQGITANNYVLPGTLLDYVVRFQNTGSDTAYTVRVVDTLSEYLNLATLQHGLSSYPYTFDVSGRGRPILIFTFNNINLPDSATDEAGSQGFIKFKIAPLDSVDIGTVIENKSEIYFDYNIPVITNTAWVTISDTVLIGETIQLYQSSHIIDSVSICPGDSLLWQGNYYDTEGTYFANYKCVLGYDSIHELNLFAIQEYFYEELAVCENDSILWEGNYYSSPGIYTEAYSSMNGCDSTLELSLYAAPNYSYSDSVTICANDSLSWQGVFRLPNNTYSASYPSINGCDSTYFLVLNSYPLPQIDQIFGQDTVVQNQIEIYYVGIDSMIYSWNVISGNILTHISNNSVEVQWTTMGTGYVTVQGLDSCGILSDLFMFPVEIGVTNTNTPDIDSSITIYPNPTSGKVQVVCTYPITLELYSLDGKLIIATDHKEFDISHLSPATYLVLIKDENGLLRSVQKCVKK